MIGSVVIIGTIVVESIGTIGILIIGIVGTIGDPPRADDDDSHP